MTPLLHFIGWTLGAVLVIVTGVALALIALNHNLKEPL